MSAIKLEKGLNTILEKMNLNELSCAIINQNGTIIGVLFDADEPICKDGMILKFLENQSFNLIDLNVDDASFLNYLSQKWGVKNEDGSYLFGDLVESIKAENKKDVLEKETIKNPFLIDYMSDHEDETEFTCGDFAYDSGWRITFDDEFDGNTELELGLLIYYLCTNLRVREAITSNKVEVDIEEFQRRFPLDEWEWWTLFNRIEDAVINKNPQKCAKIYQTFLDLEEKYPIAFSPSTDRKENENES